MTKNEIDLINHVWKKCMNSSEGRAFFSTESLAKEFFPKAKLNSGIFKLLKNQPELTARVIVVEGSGWFVEVSIPQVYLTAQYRAACQRLAKIDLDILQGRIVKNQSDFFKELRESLTAGGSL